MAIRKAAPFPFLSASPGSVDLLFRPRSLIGKCWRLPMHAPCPVPLQSPWSPVGYQVVEIGGVPAAPATAVDGPVPSSPVGYCVTLVVEETIPPPAPEPRYVSRPRRRRKQALALWAPFAAGGLVIVTLMVGLVAAHLASWEPLAAEQAVVFVAQPPNMALARGPQVVLPEVPAGKAEAPRQAQLADDADALVEDRCEDRCEVGDRETFGTRVAFARNPTEAARTATAERKLTFVLHVSGNFEEARFT
jgi:hypothetical protein